MRMDDVRIRAMNASVLVDGQLSLELSEPNRALIGLPAYSAIGIYQPFHSLFSWEVSAYERIERGPDGLYSAPPPVATVAFGANVPSLKNLLGMFLAEGSQALSMTAQNVRLVSVRLPFSNPAPDKSPVAFLQCDHLELVLDASADGLRIRFTTRAATMVDPPDGVDVAGTIVRGDIHIPSQSLVAASLPCISAPEGRYNNTRPLSVEALRGGELGSGDGLLAEGQVDWQQTGDERDPRGPFVDLYLGEHGMGLTPASKAIVLDDGSFRVQRGGSDSPLLTINLGVADFARMLEHEDKVDLSLRGAGIGYIDGRTGRDAYEEGSLRQEIEWLDFKLERDSLGLAVTGKGEFLPLPTRDSGKSLGPRLNFAFQLPRTLILARGFKLPRFWDDRKQDYPVEGAW